MQYREFKPSALLSPYVECLWTLEGNNWQTPDGPERLLPDGCVELVMNFGLPFREHLDQHQTATQPARFLVGQMTRPLLLSPSGPFQILGIRFQPGGTVPFFPFPIAEVTNCIVPLADIDSRLENGIVARVCEERQLSQKVRLTEQLLDQQLKACSTPGTSLRPAVSRILRSRGQVSIDSLAHDLGISGRQLGRRFQVEVGVGPKLLCRILRFQRIFSALERDDETWAGLALDCGYYDQAHLIKDFQQFTGQSPSRLFDQFTAFTEQFTRKRRMSDFYNPAD
ncbi:MAG TPA: AraC family transcriptional regulator [Pyrinomonadaceae bacterium]|nr:AraC family transcriptional regulator [Pyrinomonadaceae bacterium]